MNALGAPRCCFQYASSLSRMRWVSSAKPGFHSRQLPASASPGKSGIHEPSQPAVPNGWIERTLNFRTRSSNCRLAFITRYFTSNSAPGRTPVSSASQSLTTISFSARSAGTKGSEPGSTAVTME